MSGIVQRKIITPELEKRGGEHRVRIAELQKQINNLQKGD